MNKIERAQTISAYAQQMNDALKALQAEVPDDDRYGGAITAVAALAATTATVLIELLLEPGDG